MSCPDPETVAREADVKEARRLWMRLYMDLDPEGKAESFPMMRARSLLTVVREEVASALLLSKESLAAREAEVERLKKALRSIADNPWSKDPARLTREDAIVNFTASCAQARAALSAASRGEEGKT